MIRNLLVLILLAFTFSLPVTAGCRRGEQVVFCDDRAGILTESRQARLTGMQQKLLQEVNIHLMVVVLGQAEIDIDRAAVALFERYRVGEPTRSARGVLFVVDPFGGKVRMEIGYALEEIFPDGFVARIEREQMVPFFAAGRVSDGIEATVELLIGRALGDAADPSGTPWKKEALSGGGGAKTAVTIGGGSEPPRAGAADAQTYAAGASPEETLSRYRQVLTSHNKNPELPLYTPESRSLLGQWLVTDAQQANELKNLTTAQREGEWAISGARAVLRSPLSARQLPPYLFRQGEEGWMLDLDAMNRLIGFNHLNQWHFRQLDHPYIFAFKGVDFDANGYPRR